MLSYIPYKDGKSAFDGGFNGSLQHRAQSIGRSFNAQGLSRSLVEPESAIGTSRRFAATQCAAISSREQERTSRANVAMAWALGLMATGPVLPSGLAAAACPVTALILERMRRM